MSSEADNAAVPRPRLPLAANTLSVQIPAAARDWSALDAQSPHGGGGGTSLTPRLHESLSLSSPQSSYRGLQPSPSHHVSSRRRLDHGGMAKAVTATPGERAGQEQRPASYPGQYPPGQPRPDAVSIPVVQPATFDVDAGSMLKRLSPQRASPNFPAGPPKFDYADAGSPSPSAPVDAASTRPGTGIGLGLDLGVAGALSGLSPSRAMSGESDGSAMGGIFSFDGASPPHRAKARSPARARGSPLGRRAGSVAVPGSVALAGGVVTPMSMLRPDSVDSANSASTRCPSTDSGLSTRSLSVGNLASFGRRSSLATASTAGSNSASNLSSNLSSPASASPPLMATSEDIDSLAGGGGDGGGDGGGATTRRPSPTRSSSSRKPPPRAGTAMRLGLGLGLGFGGAAAASAEEGEDAGAGSIFGEAESEFAMFARPRGRGQGLNKRLSDAADLDRLASASPTTAAAYRFGGMAVASPLSSPSPSPSPSPPLSFSGRRRRCLDLAQGEATGAGSSSAAEDAGNTGRERASPPTPLPDAAAAATGTAPIGFPGLLPTPAIMRSESPVMLRKRSRTVPGLLQSPQPRSGGGVGGVPDAGADTLGILSAAEQQRRSENAGLSLSHGALAGFTLHRSREGKLRGQGRNARGKGGRSSGEEEDWHVPPSAARSKSADHASSSAASSAASASASAPATEPATGGFVLQRSCSVPFADPPQLLLPTKPSKQVDLKVITHDTLAKVIDGAYDSVLSGYTIVDCRFHYEYAGGHVRGGKLLNDPQQNAEYFFREPLPECQTHALIFHCEFSQNRAPKMMRHIRELDRKIHAQTYPELYYPQMYLLEDGYKNFFAHQPDHCEPRSYMPMDEKKNECGRSMSSLRASWKEFKGKKPRRDSILRRSAPH